MVKCGNVVREPIYDSGTNPVKFGDIYDEATCKLDYENEVKTAIKYKEEGKYIEEDWDCNNIPKPLSPAAWSFLNGPFYAFDDWTQVHKFDYTTLYRIFVSYESEINVNEKRKSFDDLIKKVKEIVQEEFSLGEIEIDHQPVSMLMQGILLSNNWYFLSDSDLKKIARANGAFVTSYIDRKTLAKEIFTSQVELIQEMVNKNATGNGDESRGYDVLRAVLRDNKIYLQIPISPQDLPQLSDRKKALGELKVSEKEGETEQKKQKLSNNNDE